MPPAPPGQRPAGQDELVDAVLRTSRLLVAVALRSLSAAAEEVTLPQYRALVVLADRGPQRVADLAAELDVSSSTATRMCDRLERKELAHRSTDADDRRVTTVAITSTGRAVVDQVVEARRAEIARLLRRMPAASRRTVIDGLASLSAAAGQEPEQPWTLGWDT